MLKVLGKGNKERLIPIGKQVQRCLWRYISRFRPEPATANSDFLFLIRDGRPMTKDRVEKIIAHYGRGAELKGVRCSPHTLRHTAAVKFLRNGGDVFSLQRMLGHASLDMTRRYCELADIDVKRAHMTASPVDNLDLSARLQRARSTKGASYASARTLTARATTVRSIIDISVPKQALKPEPPTVA